MIAKRNRLFVLLALLVFSATSSFAMLSEQSSTAEASKVFFVAEDVNADQNQSITTIKKFTGFVVKGNETTSSGFQNLQNEKKYLTTNLALVSTKTFVAFYSTYCQYRINSMNDSPFYIVYHRLTI